jgi:hypothetical protein
MFFDIWIDSFMDEKMNDMKDRDIRTMSKYPRKMDEVIDAMDLIVVVWRLQYAEIGTCLRAASEFRGSL